MSSHRQLLNSIVVESREEAFPVTTAAAAAMVPPPSSKEYWGESDDSSSMAMDMDMDMDLGLKEAVGRRDWNSLPADVLRLVLTRLPLPDAIRSSTVCKWWRSLAAEARAGQSEFPWLWSGDSPDFYSLSDGRYYALDLSRFGDWSCIGVYQDWLVLSSTKRVSFFPKSPQLDSRVLYNPFSAARIQLPSLTNPGVHKVVLSSPPDRDPNCRAAFVCHLKNCIGFCSVADGNNGAVSDWEKLSCPEKFCDVVFYDNSLLAATLDGELKLIHTSSKTMASLLPPPPELQAPASVHPGEECRLKICSYSLLVSGGDLLMLDSFRNRPLAVFKANFQLGQWEMAESLKGEAIFLLHNSFVSMRPAKSFGIEEDAIYTGHPYLGIDMFRVKDRCLMGGYWIREAISDIWRTPAFANRIFYMLIPKSITSR